MKIQKTKLALGVAAGLGLLVASTGAMAISTGTDLNLSGKARAGGMAGAAYTAPQEASAAVFGNPATLTQFKGINMNFGASFLSLASIDVTTEAAVAGGALSKKNAHSDADNYIVPDFGLTIQVAPNLYIGTGLEVDAGLGADYRDDPVANAFSLVVEVISFNANFAAAYEATENLSLGGAVTVGFALAQLGTSGELDLLGLGATTQANFLPTSSVHDIGLGGSLGATYKLADGITASATWKSEVQYHFKNILENVATDGAGNRFAPGHQTLTLEQPQEIILGVAFDDVLAPGLLVEADVVWKNWSQAETYDDAFEDQFLFLLGAQYEMGDLTLRTGYSYAENIMKSDDSAHATLDGLDLRNNVLGGTESGQVVELAQMTLLPTIWNHTITAGIGYKVTDAVSVDAYAAYAFGEEASRDLGLGPGATVPLKLDVEVDYELMVGAGINIALP